MGTANDCELTPVKHWHRKEERDVDITVWTCGAFGVGTEEVGGYK